MEPAIVSAFIKPDRPAKRFPKLGEMVRVEGRKGLFLVKGVNWDLGTADLMQRVGNQEVFELGVPCKLIRMVPRSASKAIRQFLGSDLLRRQTKPATGSSSFEAAPSQQTH